MIGARHNIKQAHDDNTESFYFGIHLNQNIKLLKLKKNFISTNKKPREGGTRMLSMLLNANKQVQ